MKKLLACALVATMSGCPDVKVDPDEAAGGPTVEFDPARSQLTKARFIPFPNDLVRDPMTGKINLPEQACESPTSKATRENILNTLDGFGTFETAMQVTFTQPVDAKSAADPASYRINTYTYIYQAQYGSPEVDGTIPMITKIDVSEDRRRVRLTLDEMAEGHVHELHLDGVRSAAGEPLLHPVGYYTLNYIPD